MKNLAVSRRYAKALLLIGKEDGQAELYRAQLGEFSKLISQNKQLEQAFTNPLYDTEGRKRVLLAVIELLDLSKIVKAFLLLLFDKGRIGLLDSINDFYQKLADEFKGVALASLVSATELSSEAIEKIRESLSKVTGKEVKLEVKQDPELIGGVVTRIGDLVLDGSVRTQLLNMRESLKRGESV
ncbi:ATP synthase F1 subunit delta [Desulfococcus sp.]|uniref:ATP synthase F1 subunit delta n=1 Tax=Desulfococcus sp. TaxID=2025834 RepID=UPI003592F59E